MHPVRPLLYHVWLLLLLRRIRKKRSFSTVRLTHFNDMIPGRRMLLDYPLLLVLLLWQSLLLLTGCPRRNNRRDNVLLTTARQLNQLTRLSTRIIDLREHILLLWLLLLLRLS